MKIAEGQFSDKFMGMGEEDQITEQQKPEWHPEGFRGKLSGERGGGGPPLRPCLWPEVTYKQTH